MTINAKDIFSEIFGDAIYTYSREEAVQDGVLVNLTQLFPQEIKDIGIKVPTFCSNVFYETFIKVPKCAPCQDGNGRLWDVLYMSKRCLIKASTEGNELRPQFFEFYCSVKRRKASPQRAKVVFDGEAFTYMMKDED